MFNVSDEIIVNNKKYIIVSFLGKGKGGYSYLAKYESSFYVLKKIHHEPCSFYTFSNKIEAGYEADDLTPHLVAFGKDREEFNKLMDFLDDNDINDLHTGNIGVNSNGRYVFTDYAGY